MRGIGENRARRVCQGSQAKAPHFRPAQPAVVEPPVVMMRHQRDAAPLASVRQFASQHHVARDAKIVCPDDGVLRAGANEQAVERRTNAPAEGWRRRPLFREIAEGWFGEKLHRRVAKVMRKRFIPLPILRFARGQHDSAFGSSELPQQIRRGQFNHAPDASGPEMVMEDDQPNRASTVAPGEPAANHE